MVTEYRRRGDVYNWFLGAGSNTLLAEAKEEQDDPEMDDEQESWIKP